MPRSLKKARKPPFTIEGAMNAIKKGRRTSKGEDAIDLGRLVITAHKRE